MSRVVFIIAMLSIASAAQVDDGASVAEAVNTVPGVCEKLIEVNETYLLSPAEFRTSLKGCSETPKHDRENLTNTAKVLVEVYEAISKHACSFEEHSDIENNLVQCVKDNGLNKFSKEEAISHFSMNGTVDLIFKTQQCKTAEKILECVNRLFSEKKCTRELKGCKDNILGGFEVTSLWCDANSLGEVSGGHTFLPSLSLILGSILMLAKIGFLSRF